MAARIEARPIERGFNFGPVLAVLLAAGVAVGAIAIGISSRGEPAQGVRAPESVSAWGLDREALAQSGFTGRLGGVAVADWTKAALSAGYDGRLGAATESPSWTQQAIDAGYTGRLGATTVDRSVIRGIGPHPRRTA